MRTISRALTTLVVIAMVPGLLSAQGMSCRDTPGAEALDFWFGDWEVTAEGRPVGRNRIEAVLDGCAVVERWEAESGGRGRSLFYFLPATAEWKQVWVTDRAGAVGGVKEKRLTARLPDGGVRFQGRVPLADGGSYLDRTTLTPLEDGRVRQVIEVSTDGGDTWRGVFDGLYTPTADTDAGPADAGPASEGTDAAAARSCADADGPAGVPAAADSPRSLVERALAVMGGPEAIGRLGGLRVRAEGVFDAGADGQGRRPGSRDPAPYEETLAVDGSGRRVAHEYRHERHDGTWEWVREAYLGPDEHRIIGPPDRFSVLLLSAEHRQDRRHLLRRFPPLLLEEARDGADRLVWLGRRTGHPAVGLPLPGGDTLALLFAPCRGTLERVEYGTHVPLRGQIEVSWRYGDFAPVDGLGLFPHAYAAHVDGRVLLDMRVTEVETGAAAARRLLEPPDGAPAPDTVRLPEEPDPAAGARVRTVAPGVHQVLSLRTGFHPLFIEMEDHIVAVDAPAGYPLLTRLPARDVAPGPRPGWLSERYLELIEATAPGKPVRYVVLTHLHEDHAGGLRPFLERGATVLVADSAGARTVRAFARSPRVRSSLPPGPVRVEVVDGRRVLTDGGRRLEILDVGPNPHTQAMLVVRLPEEGILFVSDLFTPASPESFPTPEHEALDRWFVGWLERRDLDPAWIYAMHGASRAPREVWRTLGGEGFPPPLFPSIGRGGPEDSSGGRGCGRG